MRLKSFLLYSLLFSYSSLFSLTCSDFNRNNDLVDVRVGSEDYNTIAIQGKPINTYFCVSPNSSYISIIPNIRSNGYGMRYDYSFIADYDCGSGLEIYNGSCVPECQINEIRNEDGVCEVPPPSPVECKENELLNENNDCIPLDSLKPTDFPNDEEANGQAQTGTLPLTMQGCQEMERYSSNLGVFEVLGWDYASQSCKVVAFKCGSGLVYDSANKKCIVPPDNTNFGLGDKCENDNWAKRVVHNWCSSVGIGVCGAIYFPESDMECGKAYIEYQCVKDYRIKRYVEISCGNPIPNENNTNYLDTDNLKPTEFSDLNTSNLPAIDPTKTSLKNSEDLKAIEDAIKSNLSPKIDVTNDKLSSINNGISTMNNNLSGIDGKLSSANVNLQSLSSGINNINNTLNTTGEGINSSSMDIDITALNGTESIMNNFADNVKDLTDGITSIKDKYEETKQLLSGNIPAVEIGGGSCSNEYITQLSHIDSTKFMN